MQCELSVLQTFPKSLFNAEEKKKRIYRCPSFPIFVNLVHYSRFGLRINGCFVPSLETLGLNWQLKLGGVRQPEILLFLEWLNVWMVTDSPFHSFFLIFLHLLLLKHWTLLVCPSPPVSLSWLLHLPGLYYGKFEAYFISGLVDQLSRVALVLCCNRDKKNR